ncbi:MAG: hypothetical protein J6V32_06130 [Elusimicrobiaceae bacterium]|nr:hypothetical protein [Elusimicrobiaceae bacterium]
MKKLILCVLSVLLFGPALRAESTGEILTFPANPEKGFHWGYALYVPKDIDTSKTLPMLLIMGNTGRADLSAEETEKAISEQVPYQSNEGPLADSLGVPLVMPIVPRLDNFYTHALSRAVLISQDEKFERLDLQVLNMLKDARRQLNKRNIKTQEKVFVTGFSAAGVFAWRWTMLHPEYVIATVTGGALYHMLPVEELNGEKLIYPVGVGDLKELTGKNFNKTAWSKIPIFSSNGQVDANDTFVYSECFDPEIERLVLAKVLPGKDIFERRAQSIKLLNEMAPNVQTHLYPSIGHQPVTKDVLAFLQLHRDGGPLKPFTPTDTSGMQEKTSDISGANKISVTKAVWGNDSLPEHLRNVFGPNILILEAKGEIPINKYDPYKVNIFDKKNKILVLKSNGSVSDDNHTLLLYALREGDFLRLSSKNKKRKFTVRAKHPEILDIPENLTFTVK